MSGAQGATSATKHLPGTPGTRLNAFAHGALGGTKGHEAAIAAADIENKKAQTDLLRAQTEGVHLQNSGIRQANDHAYYEGAQRIASNLQQMEHVQDSHEQDILDREQSRRHSDELHQSAVRSANAGADVDESNSRVVRASESSLIDATISRNLAHGSEYDLRALRAEGRMAEILVSGGVPNGPVTPRSTAPPSNNSGKKADDSTDDNPLIPAPTKAAKEEEL